MSLRPSIAFQSSTIPVPPYRIHTLEAGAGTEPVVLIHGLSGSSRWWLRNIAALGARYRVVVPDVIGFGRTRCPGKLPGPDEIASVLVDWMATVGAGKAHVVGHSMGGQICAHLAAGYPDHILRLVLADAAGIPRPLGAGELVRLALDIVPPRCWGDPLFFPVIARDALRAGPGTLLQAVGHILRDDVRSILPRINAPTLVVWGQNDALVPLWHAREFRRLIPNARLEILAGAGHNVMVDRPDVFNRAVLRFLGSEQTGE